MNRVEMFDRQKGLVIPDCPLPKNVVALATTRCSFEQIEPRDHYASGYDNFNLALHVNDNKDKVLANRALLAKHLSLAPSNMTWLEQVHGTRLVHTEDNLTNTLASPLIADAITSASQQQACTVMTADCLPVLFCDVHNNENNVVARQVAAAHAGWRGLAEGILTKTVSSFSDAKTVIAWLGPAISQKHFEVGKDVYDAFVSKNPMNKPAFMVSPNSTPKQAKWLASLTELAKIELQALGIKAVYDDAWCTYTRSDLFFSYRRDGAQSGRVTSLIMLT